jgi:hypothetical protein
MKKDVPEIGLRQMVSVIEELQATPDPLIFRVVVIKVLKRGPVFGHLYRVAER